jgi:exodeoxyribonuclease V gamma subunit
MPDGMTSPRHPQFFLHLSNRLEVLADQLAHDLAATTGDPMALRTVVVSSAETSRWLSMQLADRQGLAMGVRYPFLRRVVDELTTAMLGGQRRYSPLFGREAMAWWFFDKLPGFISREDFELVRHYLRDGSALRRFELARRIADLFDQYQVYRPQMLKQWDTADTEGGWQGVLWRALRHDLAGQESFVDLHQALSEQDDASVVTSRLPSSLAIFSLNTIPPAFLDVLRKASGHLRIDLYLLTPTDEYWSDLLTKKQQLKTGIDTDDLCGNPLGISLGKLGRDLLEQLLTREAQQTSEHFDHPVRPTLLGRLQDDLRSLRDRSVEPTKDSVSGDDTSIEIHSCHGPMREVEVLHDYLLGLFQDDATLKTRDVIVMAPNIEAYAPYISAVFGAPESELSQIPYSLADQSARSGFGTADAFLKLLALGLSRFESTRVLGLLETEMFRRCFRLDGGDLEQIRTWIKECGTVWGLDAEHRARLGFGNSDDFTWARLEATLLDGYALNGEGSRLLNDILPYSDLEGDHLDTLERFLSAFDALRYAAQQLRGHRTRSAWAEVLRQILLKLKVDDQLPIAEVRSIRDVLSELEQSERSDSSEAITADVIAEFLDSRLRETPVSGGFLDGRVTFCSMKPMRAIPARVIALLGMNEADFPRQTIRPSFDFIAMDPIRGDRSLRDDDRYLFLESLLSARDRLFISHAGQSYHDPRKSPPSSVVIELIDYLSQGFILPESVSERLDIQHRLQAFSRHYFEIGSPRSFSQANADAAAVLARQAPKTYELFTSPLGESGPDSRRLTPSRLCEFFVNPARQLCEQRLGIRLEREQDGLPTHEPIDLDALASYQLQQTLVESKLRDDDQPIWDAARARGRLPTGPFGNIAQEVIEQKVERFIESVRTQIGQHTREHRIVRWESAPWTIDGRIDGLYGDQLLRARCAAIKAKDLVSAWIEHLLVNLASPGITTRLVDRDGAFHIFRPPAKIEITNNLVEDLLTRYGSGLTQPLKFFPQSSLAYAEAALKAGERDHWSDDGLRAAIRFWQPNEFSRSASDSEDPWNALIYGDRLPFDDRFRDTAIAFFEPLLTHFEGDLP